MDSENRGFSTMNTESASGGTLPPGMTEDESVEVQVELFKVEEEILTLRQVLAAKERHAAELRRRLGINPLSEFKQNISKSWQEVQSSNAYMKTSQTLGDLNDRVKSSNLYLTASATLDDISHSDAYKKTQETLSQAGQMTSSALSTMGSAIKNRLGDLSNSYNGYSMRQSLSMPTMRNSSTFKNIEDKMTKAMTGKSDDDTPPPPGDNSTI
ncbi:tpd52 like 2a isoform X2 [Brachyhypopomus gauderio]|uniref:tpd52 like 2a isoform X2 n=1 Tax=Brachyhypopomus gauderio TaxID=698409 RepID=UPI0040418674